MVKSSTDPEGQEDPLIAAYFALEIDDVEVGMFKSVSGLDVSVEVTEIRQADSTGKTVMLKIPGQVHYGDITFTRGMTKNSVLYDWHKEIIAGNYQDNQMKTGAVVLYDQTGEPVVRWNLDRAWPSKLTTGQFSADQTEVLIEEMTFVVNSIERE